MRDPDERDREREQAEEELREGDRDARALHGLTIPGGGSGPVQDQFRRLSSPRRGSAARRPKSGSDQGRNLHKCSSTA